MNTICKGCFGSYDKKYKVCPHCGYYEGAKPKEPFQLEIGTELVGRYVLGNVIGFGGFGITYKAWDNTLEMVVAIKEYYPSGMVNRVPGIPDIILFSGAKKKEFQFGLERFILEAQHMAKFSSHENIINVFTYFEENNTAYIVMEFLDGHTLNEEVKEKGMLPLERSMEIIYKTCNALQDIHATGIIHRDISPDNIFLCNNGTVKLIDFGAARFSQKTETNYTIILKPGFAPPEQYEKISEQGSWTDIYAVGSTLYYLVTGQKPEESTNRKIKDTLQEPIQVNPQVPQYVSDGIMKAMALEINMRFKKIEDFVAVIRKEKKIRPLKKEKQLRQAKRFVGILALMALVVSAAVLFNVNFNKKKEEIALPTAELKMWYPQTQQETYGAAYASIVEDFCKEFDNVRIHLEAIPDQNYQESVILDQAGPNLFLNDDLITKNDSLLDLSACVSADNESAKMMRKCGGDYLFLDMYTTHFTNRNQIPLGYVVPTMYVNTSLVSFDEDIVPNLSAVLCYADEEHTILVNKKMRPLFEKMFGDLSSPFISFESCDTFVEGQAAFYFGGSDEFFTIRTMPSLKTGIPKAVQIGANTISGLWGQLWSVRKGTDAQNTVAIRLLQYMLSDNAQVKLFCAGNSNHAMPINETALSTFCSVFEELDFVLEDIDKCSFLSNP